MERKLDGRVAIITGSSSGNGRAVALALAAAGASVICSDVRKSALAGGYESDIEIDTDDVIRSLGGKAVYVLADVSKASDVSALVEVAVSRFGRLDILVNNAGWAGDFATVVEETEEVYDRTMAINVKGVWLGCKYAIAQFLKQAPLTMANGRTVRGRIVNIASMGGLVGLAKEPAYCASKGAVVNLTRQIAIDFAKEYINVNAICPGFLATAMVREALDDAETNKWLHSQSPWPHLGTTDDVATATLFLASDDAQWMSGSMLTVDGARTAG